MKTNKLLAIFIAIVTIYNSNFCMEQQEKQWLILKPLLAVTPDGKYEKLKKVLTEHIVDDYNTIHPQLQYEMLKTCIYENNMIALHCCLNHHLNPNRYHKGLSLLHCAIRQNKSEAIFFLSYSNPDLIPLNEQRETPLDYAIRLKYAECIDAMACVITEKLKDLTKGKDGQHCGLTKHILQTGRCNLCIEALSWQLHHHGLNSNDYTNVQREDYTSSTTNTYSDSHS